MLLLQLAAFLRSYDGTDGADMAKQAILEWGMSSATDDGIAIAARKAIDSLPCANSSAAYSHFMQHLEEASRMNTKTVRRGGRQARLMSASLAAAA